MIKSFLLPFILSLALAASAHAVVTLEWVTVGDAGNAADPNDGDPLTGGIQNFGAVAYEYQIMKYEVTNAQYCEFLNAKAASDPNGLYRVLMGTNALGGINRTGSSGSFVYTVKSGYADMPVVFVSNVDAQRFANWIHNGQGTGDTETGAYTVGNLAIHTGSANVWIPTENEWYKAAYYQPSGAGGDTDNYWLYPTMSNTQPTSATPPSGIVNVANYYFDDTIANGINGGYATTQSTSLVGTTNYLSNVGTYSNSASYYGTFDQGGNAWEMNEAIYGSERGLRGGSWIDTEDGLASSSRDQLDPVSGENQYQGFRLASLAVPEPSRALLLLGGLVCMTLRRRR